MTKKEINQNEELLETRSGCVGERTFDILSPLPIDSFGECHEQLDSSLNYKMVSDLLDQIELEESNHSNPSLIRFKKESFEMLSSYIESSLIEQNNAMKKSDLRNEYISSIISKRINLFKNLISNYEDELVPDIMEYLGY